MVKNRVLVLSLLMVAMTIWSPWWSAAGPVWAQDATVHLAFFYAEGCEHCAAIKDEFFPTLLAEYGDRLEISYLEISDPAVFKQMLSMEERHKVPPETADIPEVYIGDQALIGESEIRAKLGDLVDSYLANGGVELAVLPGTQTDEPVVRFYLFYGETCPHCHEIIDNYLPTVYEKYGAQVEYEYLEVWSETDNYLTMLALETKLGVPEADQGSVPALVIGDKVLIGSLDIPNYLETYIDEYLAQGGVDFPSLEDLPEVVVPTPEPTVQLLLFFDPNHPDFDPLNTLMVGLGQTHGSGVQAYAADLSQSENVAILTQVNAALGVEAPAAGTPQVLIDHRMLVGIDQIERELPGLVEQYLAQGGVRLPSLEELVSGGPAATATSVPIEPAQKPIYLAYFEKAGCQECARTSYDLRLAEDQYPQLVVERFPEEEADNVPLHKCLSEQYGVPEEDQLNTPMVFVGEEVLYGDEATTRNLLAAVAKYTATGAERTWDEIDAVACRDEIKIDWPLLTVFFAGLVDGLNPCAFATLVFFISYLAFTGRRGRDILFVGLAFALGIFVTYLLLGFGLLKVVQALPFFTSLGRWVYLFTALLCGVLAVLTFRDFFKARAGGAGEMTLKLPLNLRRMINKVIRENAQTRAFVAMAFVTGFLVSLIELACTGQVYLPTIVYVLSLPGAEAQAYVYLLIYCLAFIVPLIVVFGLSYFGTTSEQLGQFVNRHTSTIKMVTGLVFVGLTLWMTWTLAPLFGLAAPWTWLLVVGVLVAIVVGVIVLKVTEKPDPRSKKRTSKQRRSRA